VKNAHGKKKFFLVNQPAKHICARNVELTKKVWERIQKDSHLKTASKPL